MHSHVSIVLSGENEYINDVSRSACEDVHKTRILKVTESHIVRDIEINQTITHSLMFSGYINSKGKCNGVGHSNPFGTWENIVMQGTIKISLSCPVDNCKFQQYSILYEGLANKVIDHDFDNK